MVSIPFVKYSGCGNDFVVIDNRDLELETLDTLIPRLCDRNRGVGADGVLLLETSLVAQFRMRIFNADGSEAEMCGNGVRCLAHFIHQIENIGNKFTIETMHQTMSVVVNESLVSVAMPSPQKEISHHNVSVDNREFSLNFLDTGVPHAIHFVDDLNRNDLLPCAPKIRFHPEFQPRGTNVNFAEVLSNKNISVRTYERGVEGETLACGTGAVAVALAAAALYGTPTPITIMTRSGDPLSIDFQGIPPYVTNLVMTGPAIRVYEGVFKPNL